MIGQTSDAFAALGIEVVEGLDAEYQARPPSRRRQARPQTETVIRAGCASEILQRGGYVLVKHQTLHGQRGTPDLIGCLPLQSGHGRTVVIEVKREDADPPTPMQIAQLRRWQEVGALAGWVRSVEHLRQLLDRLTDTGWRNDFTAPGDGRAS